MKKMPAHLPPLPDGAVYLGRCEEVVTSSSKCEYHEGWYCSILERWGIFAIWQVGPGSGRGHFAAPADSEIARLNGCGKPSWESAPEWAEWLAQDKHGPRWWYEGRPEKLEWEWNSEYVRFRSAHAGEGPPNPNWRDTLERRPDYGRVNGGFVHVTVRDGGVQLHQSPDLIIPADIAKHADIHSMVALHRDGYRIEWDSNGIRGWKE